MFKEIDGIRDIVNSEGPIVRLMERTDLEPDQHNLYIEGVMKDGIRRILCRVSPEALMLYFSGRMRLSDLFLVRSDEGYFIRRRKRSTHIRFTEDLSYDIKANLTTGCCFYTELAEGMRSYRDPGEVMKTIKLFW
jgi:hypothetical protein